MDLKRKLDSVGKRAFVKNFDVFQEYASGRIARDAAIEKLVSLGVSNEAGAAIRVDNAKLIFDNGLALEALHLVLQAKKVPDNIIDEVKRIINKLAS